MLPAVLSNFIWGVSETQEEPTDHITVETEDWLLIERSAKAPVCEDGSAPVDYGSQVTSDNESVCSDASWVVAPAPRFRGSPETNESKQNHPLENLLIEHPTMSVYGQIPVIENIGAVQNADVQSVATVSDQSRQAVSRQRHQLALHMNVPPKVPVAATQRVQFKHPKLSRKSLTRHNANITKTRAPRMQTRQSKAAGRRGC